MKSGGITARVRAGSSVTRTSASPAAAWRALSKPDSATAAATKPAARIKNVRRFIVLANDERYQIGQTNLHRGTFSKNEKSVQLPRPPSQQGGKLRGHVDATEL